MLRLLRGFIPRYIGAGAVLGFLRIFSFRIPKRVRAKHFDKNLTEWERLRGSAMTGAYIEKQSALGGMALGNTRASVNSCEVIAVYNALAAMGDDRSGAKDGKRFESVSADDFPKLLSEFERRGVVFFGAFGTAPERMLGFLRDKGYDCTELRGRQITEAAVGRLAESYLAFILTQYNDRNNIFAMVHSMCITRESGGYTVHNGGSAGRAFPSLYAAVTGIAPNRAQPICLIGVG